MPTPNTPPAMRTLEARETPATVEAGASRRQWMANWGSLAAGCLAAGSLGTATAIEMARAADDAAPGNGVLDRTTSIKLTRLTATPVARKV